MSIERTFYCDEKDCNTHAIMLAQHSCFLTVTGDGGSWHFCCWDCLMKYAAQFEPPEIIPVPGMSATEAEREGIELSDP